MGWAVATILYTLPILAGLRNLEAIVDDAKEAVRGTDLWYPSLAPAVAILSLFAWPVVTLYDAWKGEDD